MPKDKGNPGWMRESIGDVLRAIERQSGSKVIEHSYKRRDFPDMGLGSDRPGEFAAQVITPGYEVKVNLRDRRGRTYERRYRSNLEGSILKEK